MVEHRHPTNSLPQSNHQRTSLRAVIYIRVSDPKQAEEDKVSLAEQEADCRAYAEAHGWEVVQVYEDAGYSGASKNRPAFQKMLRDAEAGKFDIIIIWRVDRLSRGMYPATALMMALEGTSIALHDRNGPVDLDVFSILAAAGRIELRAITERIRMAARGRAKAGRIPGPVKFGYRKGEDGRPVINEEAAEVVKLIYKLYLEGGSDITIAHYLNDNGYPGPGGKLWWPRRVGDILTDEVYIGTKHWGLRRYVKKDNGKGEDVRQTLLQPKETWLDIPYPIIIEEKTFKQAAKQRRYHHRHPTGKSATLTWHLRGLVWCDVHQRPYSTGYGTGRSGKTYTYYTCNVGQRFGHIHGACPKKKIRADEMEQRVYNWLMDWISTPVRFRALVTNYLNVLRSTGNVDGVEKLRERLRALDEEAEREKLMFAKGYRTGDELDLRLKAINEQREYVQEQYDRARDAAHDVEVLLDYLQRTEGKAGEAYLEALKVEGMALVQRFIRRVTVVDAPYPDDLKCSVNADAVVYFASPGKLVAEGQPSR